MSQITEHIALIENTPVSFDNMTPMDYLALRSAYFEAENNLDVASLETETFKKGFMTLAYQRNQDNYRLKKYNEKIFQIILNELS
jgi:D-lyxose ketol-isomerase